MESLMESLKKMSIPRPRIHREGYPFIAIAVAVTLVLGYFSWVAGGIFLAIAVWVACFFRDPQRVTPVREGLFTSAADGVVLPIVQASPPAELELGDSPRTRVAVFMNVFNVHVNRVPIDGTITRLAYRPGSFLNASFDKASEDNERQSVLLKTDDGREIVFVQIAGLVARRIKCDLEVGQRVSAGDRFGLIRFGSRVDVYLPDGVEPLVVAGQRAIAGETVIADCLAQEPPRTGKVG
jgi:phosphatidylserine decarboxylase